MSDHGFTEQVSKRLLNEQWLVKIDNNTSCSYLFKFHSSDNRCCIMVTNTVDVWCEVLDSKSLIRRWRSLNNDDPLRLLERDEDLEWQAKIARTLTNAHTPLRIQETTFSIEESQEADLSIKLQNLNLGRWRWECYKLGFKTTAQLLSTHLLHPLLSLANLAFTSANSVSELSIPNLEEAVDNVAKAGRRTQAIFVRQTFSRPRVATTIARLSAILNFSNDAPSIKDNYEPNVDVNTVANGDVFDTSSPILSTVAATKSLSHSAADPTRPTAELTKSSGTSSVKPRPPSPSQLEKQMRENTDGSITEADTGDDDNNEVSTQIAQDPITSRMHDTDHHERRLPVTKRARYSPPEDTAMARNESSVNTRGAPASGHINRKVGVRQPLKRGGKRF